jgi:phenylacetate-CoA ligase
MRRKTSHVRAQCAHSVSQRRQRRVKEHTYTGTSARIELRAAGGVERSLGKAKRVLDQRKAL